MFILKVSGGQPGVVPVLVPKEACGLPLDTIAILGWDSYVTVLLESSLTPY